MVRPDAQENRISVKSFTLSVNQQINDTMQIFINGEEQRISSDTTMAQLIEQLELQDRRLAVEVNEELVPRSTFPQHRLQAGDRVEIVHAIGGG